MEPIAIVMVLALLEYFAFGLLVARARAAAGLQAPATTGDVSFERHFRVQQNTLEQLVIFLPSLWLFGYYVHVWWGAGLGLVFIVGRYLYYRGYVSDPEKRGTGFIIGEVGLGVLLLGGLAGIIVAYFS